MIKTKRIVTALLAFLAILCVSAFSACGDKSGESGYAVIEMTADKQSPKPGEEFSITISVKNGKMFCYTDLYINYNSEVVEYVSYESADIKDLQSEVIESAPGKISYAAYVATTADITTDSLVVITFKVLDGVVAGTDCGIVFASESDYAVGEEADGNNVLKISDKVAFNGCSVTVG